MSAFGDFAKVSCTHNVSIISLICNVAKTSSILERVSYCRACRHHTPGPINRATSPSARGHAASMQCVTRAAVAGPHASCNKSRCGWTRVCLAVLLPIATYNGHFCEEWLAGMLQVGRCICGREGTGYREFPTLQLLIRSARRTLAVYDD